MDIMPDKKQLRAGSTALRKHKPVPVMSSRPGVSVDYSCASCGTRFADLETAREHTVLRIVEAVSNTEGEDAMNISKPISTASRLRATFTSSAAPERAGKPIHATLSLDPGLHRRLKLAAATRGVTMSELVSSWIESNCPALDGR